MMTEITTEALTVMVSVVVILITLMFSVACLLYIAGFQLTSDSISNASKGSSSPSSPSAPTSSSSRSRKYDVFLSFRGEDTRKTFVDHLYTALVDRLIHTYKDDETLLRGDTISPSLLKAIEESQIAIIIFSKNYADSSWCLDELEYIMKCRDERGLTVIPVFYGVDPSEVRKQKAEFGKAFAKQKQKNNSKFESWKQALVDASNIAGWEPKHIASRHEAKCIKDIVGTILDKLLYLNSVVNENLIGMGTRLQDLKSQLVIGSGGVRMVGIWGIGGGGKTTLASSLYIEIRSEFDSCCFLENIKDESSMKKLQDKMLSTVLKTNVKVESVDIGKHTIKSRLGRKNVLLVLDDIDDRKQLEALAGSHDWFGEGSRIIITTRNEQLLRTHRVDEVSRVSLLSEEEAIRLFYRRAYNENKPVEDYKTLSQRVVSYAAGLPLALIVLGSFLYDKNKEEWISTLDRLKDIPEMEILKILKISYDGLTPLEKELFLDIACFFRGTEKDKAMVMLDACGFHPDIGVKVLIQKGLITIKGKYDIFDMHDLVQEMGHFIVRGEHPNNPEKHSRLWRFEDIEDMCSGNETAENNKTKAILCHHYPLDFQKLVSRAMKLRLLSVNNGNVGDIKFPEFLSNELQYMYWQRYPASPFPASFQPRKLVVLKLENSLQEELWRGNKDLPCLKELYVSHAFKLVRTPDFGGLPCLQTLTLEYCNKLKEIHPSLGNHSSLVNVKVEHCYKLRKFPTIVQMGKLAILKISQCDLSKFPEIETSMGSLVNLSLDHVEIEALPWTVGKYCYNLRSLILRDCPKVISIEGNFHALKHLQTCKIEGSYREHIKLPKDLFREHIHLKELRLDRARQPCIPHLPCFLTRLNLRSCELEDGDIPCDIGKLSNLQELDLSGNNFSRLNNFRLSQLSQLKLLNLDNCYNLVELPELPTSIAILQADGCESLEDVGNISKNCKWLCHASIKKGNIVTGGYRLLQLMLEGHAIENGCMILHLKGLDIPWGSIPPLLVKGATYRLQLPQNWYIHFSGFLLCVAKKYQYSELKPVTMTHQKSGSGMNSEVAMYWDASVDDGTEEAWFGYVSFGYLKHTKWWDTLSTNVDFFLDDGWYTWFGVRLVSKTSKSETETKTTTTTTTTTTNSSKSTDDYTRHFRIRYDSKSDLGCFFFPDINSW